MTNAQTRTCRTRHARLLLLLALCLLCGPLLRAAEVALPKTEEAKKKLTRREINILRRQMKAREDEAGAAFKNAETAFLVGEYDKAIEEFIAVSREYDDTSYRMKCVMRVGDVYYRQRKYERAVSYYQRALKVPTEIWWPEESAEDYARADYMIGVCHFDQNAMNRTFAHFRGFVKRHPESKFVDRAYDFIGRGNMEMKRYGQAIEAFRMVGTARLQRKARRTVSPGEDLYLRVTDADVGLATKNFTLHVRLSTTAGDEEVVDLESLGLGSPTFLGRIKTRLGTPRLTRSLDEAFSRQVRLKSDDSLQAAEAMDEEAVELEEELEALKKPDVPELKEGEQLAPEAKAALDKYEAEHNRLTERLQRLRDGAKQLRDQAYAELDASYGRIETVLAKWDVKLDLEEPEEKKEEAQKAKEKASEEGAAAGADEAPKDTLSDVFTQKQIVETRKGITESPTTGENYKFRRALLEYWHEQLLHEYKTLDLNGSDTIVAEYIDLHGTETDKVLRKDTLGVSADGRILCVGPDLQNSILAVIFGDEVRVKVVDVDMDRSDKPDQLQVAVSSVPKVVVKKDDLEEQPEEGEEEAEEEEEEEAPSVNLFEEEDEEDAVLPLVPEGAPSFVLTLTETDAHTGTFIGSFPTVAMKPEEPVVKLGLSLDRLVRVAYQDGRPSSREGDWVVAVEVEIVPGAEGEQEVIEMRESALDRRSELDKGVALGKLARVYQDLGLKLEARRTFDEALKVVKKVVQSERNSPLGEEATYQMWDLYFASGDEQAAAEACSKLIHTFPDSPLADDALLIMGKAEKKNPRTAMGHFGRLVQRYPDSPLAPEAQFRIAELKAQIGTFDVAAFETCANKYPDSNFAAKSLLNLAEYYMDNKDYARAKDYLERVTLDFPDFDQLDRTTYMRGVCAYRQGDIQLAYTLMHEVVEKYPGTAVARSAGKIVKLLAKKLKR